MATFRKLFGAALLTFVAGGSGCSKKDDGPPSAPPQTTTTTTTTTPPAGGGGALDGDPVAKASEVFATRCTPCHGPEGRGNGPASAGLNPPPRNFHDAAWQASVTDDHIMTIVKVGGAAVGKSAAMPSNPDFNGHDAFVAALKDKIRSFGKQP